MPPERFRSKVERPRAQGRLAGVIIALVHMVQPVVMALSELCSRLMWWALYLENDWPVIGLVIMGHVQIEHPFLCDHRS